MRSKNGIAATALRQAEGRNEVYQHMKLVTAGTITELLLSASVSPRKRMNLNLHEPGSPVGIRTRATGVYRSQVDE
jgi:hypothetical protein